MTSFPTSMPGILPPDLDNRLRSELQAGERLVWFAQPRTKGLARGSIPILLFGIPWTAFAVFWTVMAFVGTQSGIVRDGDAPTVFRWGSLAFPLFGVPFILIGIGMLSSPLWLRRQAGRTCYAITDRRAIVIEPVFMRGVRVSSYEPDSLRAMSRIERSDDSGDLIFHEVTTRDSDGDRRRTEYGFLAIDQVRDVENLIRETLLAPGQSA